MELLTEYLIFIDKDNSEALYSLCDNVQEFNKLLMTDEEISIDNETINFMNSSFQYRVTTNSVSDKHQRYFHIKIVFSGVDEEILIFENLLHRIRGVVHRSGGKPETLWDDISLYYSEKSYPIIHKVENLMRKLITYFMLTNIGKEWVIESSPTNVKDAIDKSKRKQYLDVLYQVDFIHLGDFLFKPYQVKELNDLFSILNDATNISDLDLGYLRMFEPKSNWEKYFSNLVDCTDDYLKKRWENLYDLRCQVAHNALLNRDSYNKIVQITEEIQPKLQKALDNLDKIHIPKAEIDQVAENVASNINETYGKFIQSWKEFENKIMKIASSFDKSTDKYLSITQSIKTLYENDLLSAEVEKEIYNLINMRNHLVHSSNVVISEQEIQNSILLLKEISNQINRTWKEEVYDTLFQLGGEGSLDEIYTYIENNTSRELAETWQATVRRTLQTHCPDTKTYAGGESLFVHVGKGRWALNK